MPERTVGMLTGDMPEPILVIPSDTWDTFELTGEEGEFITLTIKRAVTTKAETLFEIDEQVKCPTYRYTTMLGLRGTGVVIPKQITQSYGIRKEHYLEVILEKVEKKGEEIEIFPKRMVEEHFPAGWQEEKKK